MLVPTPPPVSDPEPEALLETRPRPAYRPRPVLTPVPTPVPQQLVHTSPQLSALASDQGSLADTAPQLSAFSGFEASEPEVAPLHLDEPPAPAAEPVSTTAPMPMALAPVEQPLVAQPPAAHPLNFVARQEAPEQLPWTHREPGEARFLRDAPPTQRVMPLEWSDSDLYLTPPPSRRRHQAALATVLGLLGTLAVVAAVFLLMPSLPTEGSIEIQSVPSGATVKLDGTVAGTTPTVLRVTDLKREHELELTLDGHTTWRDEVQLSVDEPRVGLVASMSPREKKGPKQSDLE